MPDCWLWRKGWRCHTSSWYAEDSPAPRSRRASWRAALGRALGRASDRESETEREGDRGKCGSVGRYARDGSRRARRMGILGRVRPGLRWCVVPAACLQPPPLHLCLSASLPLCLSISWGSGVRRPRPSSAAGGELRLRRLRRLGSHQRQRSPHAPWDVRRQVCVCVCVGARARARGSIAPPASPTHFPIQPEQSSWRAGWTLSPQPASSI